jgi:hypothetical protein
MLMATHQGRQRKMKFALWAASLGAALTLSSGAARAQAPLPAGSTPPEAPHVEAPATAPAAPEASPPGELLSDEPGLSVPSFVRTPDKHNEAYSRLSDVPIGLQPFPERPRLLVELNDHFLSPGYLTEGIKLPTGEIVRPSLWIFGNEQFGYQFFDNRTTTKNASEFVERLDLFTQLNLSATERAFYAIRPFDKERYNKRIYTSYEFDRDTGVNGTNADIESLFFEGDFGEIFPNLDIYDTKMLDYGFSVGRQPLLIQDGLLINANQLDAVTVTRNTLNGHGNLNFRITGMYAWDRVHRNNDIYDPKASLFGLFTESDYQKSTINIDVVYVDSTPMTGSAFYAAASAIQRLELFDRNWNTSFHVLTSQPTNQQTSATGRGTLLFSQISLTPHGTADLIYATGFWAIDNYSSAARNPEVGGPLGQTGILFASPAFGRYGAPLNNQASDVAGGAIGYQILLDSTRKQLIFELGGRKDTNDVGQGAIGFGARYQQACGRHFIFLLDSFITKQEKVEDPGVGARAVLQIKF